MLLSYPPTLISPLPYKHNDQVVGDIKSSSKMRPQCFLVCVRLYSKLNIQLPITLFLVMWLCLAVILGAILS